MEVLRFQNNVAEEVALKFDSGKCYGDQVLFSLTDGRVMYLPPAVAERIKELGIVRGETFQVGKREVTKDSKRFLEWEVKRVVPAPETAAASPAAASNHQDGARRQQNGTTEDTQLEHQLRASIAMVEERKNGLDAAPRARPKTQLESALITAIAAAAAAERYAAEIHFAVHFEHEDIRAMAISTLVGMQQNGGQR